MTFLSYFIIFHLDEANVSIIVYTTQYKNNNLVIEKCKSSIPKKEVGPQVQTKPQSCTRASYPLSDGCI